MNYLRICFCTIAILWVNLVTANSFNHQHFKIGEHLDCTQVYSVFEDSKGYIWLITDNGVIRYNGRIFNSYTVDDGLFSRMILKIGELDNGIVWAANHTGIIFFYGDDLKKQNVSINFLDYFNLSIIDVVQRDSESVLISTTHNGLIELTSSYCRPYMGDSEKFTISSFNNRQGAFISVNGERIAFSSSTKLESINFQRKQAYDSLCVFSIGKDVFSIDYRTHEIKLLYQSVAPITGIYKKLDNGLMITELAKGIFNVNKNLTEFENTFNGFFNEKKPTGIIQSREGGFWVSTLDEGVFHITNPSVFELKAENIYQKPVVKVITNDTSLFIGMKKGHVFELDKGRLNTLNNTLCEFRDFTFDKDQNLVLSVIPTGEGITTLKENVRLSKFKYRSILFTNDNEHYGLTSTGLYQIGEDSSVLVINEREEFDAWNFFLSRDTIFICAKEGLFAYIISDEKLIDFEAIYPQLSISIRNVYIVGDISIFSTRQGIIIKRGEEFLSITEEDGLANNLCNHAFIGSDSIIWVATNKGISKITDVFDSLQRKIMTIDITDGLNSELVINGCELNDTVYFATSLGVNYFHKNLETYAAISNLFIDEIKINKENVSLDSIYMLDYTENMIRIDFHGVSGKVGPQLKYQYRILPSDSTWITSTNTFVILSGLEPGDYHLELKVVDGKLKTISEIKEIRFFIAIPFYQKTAFVAAISILILLFFYFIFKRIKRHQNLLEELNVIKQQALSAQMNPHFIFNSLNSIQKYLLTNDRKNSNKYLATFSKLMRLVLENSKQKLIPLYDELETLRIYLELETLRFKEKFNCEIKISPDVDIKQYSIPPLLLQPYIENAIWHGLMHKKDGAGKLSISFESKGEMILCCIEDNGIGRKKALEIKKNNKIQFKSSGMDMTSKRMELAKKLFKQTISVDIFDLKNETRNAVGTRVEITLSKLGKGG